MKFLWFHFMPYPELPDGWERDHPSSWVNVDPTVADRDVVADAYERYLDELVYADECGYDGICVNEHHNNYYGMMPSPNLFASILAQRTTEAAIIVLGDSVALYNPPIRVAEEMAVIDHLSRGRLVAGFPTGTTMDTTYSYSVNPGVLRSKYYEGVDLIKRGWETTEPFEFNGRFNQLRYVNPIPKPYQQPHPPIWIPGGGSVETWDYCAEQDYVYGCLTYYGHASAAETIKGYWRQVEAAGKDLNPYRIALTQFIGVADTDTEAYELYREPAEYFFNRCLHVAPGFSDPPGYVTEASVRARYKSQVRAVARSKQSKHELTWDEMVSKGYVVIGSPDTVRENLEAAARQHNIGHLVTLLHFGNMSNELTKHNTKLFADKVAPGLRSVFSEFENRWWPANAR